MSNALPTPAAHRLRTDAASARAQTPFTTAGGRKLLSSAPSRCMPPPTARQVGRRRF